MALSRTAAAFDESHHQWYVARTNSAITCRLENRHKNKTATCCCGFQAEENGKVHHDMAVMKPLGLLREGEEN